MSASAILGYALVGISDQSGVIAAVVTGVCLIVAQIINSASESRRHKRELRYRNGGRGGSGVTTVLLLGILISIGGLIYFSQRPDEQSEASAGPAPPTTVIVDTTASTPASTTGQNPACAPFVVLIAGRNPKEADRPTFVAQAEQLVQAAPEVGELHTNFGAGCIYPKLDHYFFGPFQSDEAAHEMCLAIGRILRDNEEDYSTFVGPNGIYYPFYYDASGRVLMNSQDQPVVCDPG